LIGASGAGKSEFGNLLLGKVVFAAGRGVGSFTTETVEASGQFLGKENFRNITVIDAPGHDDSEGRDYQHAL
jgi:predicted GTPase